MNRWGGKRTKQLWNEEQSREADEREEGRRRKGE